MDRDPRLLLWDAKRSAEAILRFTAEIDVQGYSASEMVRSAVERQFEILGEALNRLRRVDPETASRVSGLRGAVALRNVLSHGYETVDDSTVWAIVRSDVAPMIEELDRLIAERGAL